MSSYFFFFGRRNWIENPWLRRESAGGRGLFVLICNQVRPIGGERPVELHYMRAGSIQRERKGVGRDKRLGKEKDGGSEKNRGGEE